MLFFSSRRNQPRFHDDVFLSPHAHQLTFIFKMADVSMQKVKDLMAKKDAIEKEIKEFQDVLESVSSILKQLDV